MLNLQDIYIIARFFDVRSIFFDLYIDQFLTNFFSKLFIEN